MKPLPSLTEVKTWTVRQLREFCRDYKVKGYSRLCKADLLAFVLQWIARSGDDRPGGACPGDHPPRSGDDRPGGSRPGDHAPRRSHLAIAISILSVCPIASGGCPILVTSGARSPFGSVARSPPAVALFFVAVGARSIPFFSFYLR